MYNSLLSSMDGLSAAASLIGVASITVQLADSIKKLYEFWSSITDAPEDVQNVAVELALLTSVLSDIASEARYGDSDNTFTAVMEACMLRVKTLDDILLEIKLNLASASPIKRKWAAVKSILNSDRIKKFQTSLEGLKSTLILVRQQQHR